MVLGKLLYVTGVDIALQRAAGGLAILFGTEKFYDLTGSVTYLLLAYLTYPCVHEPSRLCLFNSILGLWVCGGVCGVCVRGCVLVYVRVVL